MTNPFYRLAPFIQDFIYREKWGELRQIQVDAISAVLDTKDHILITSGTASGKTEAAFLPILTDLFEHPPATIGAMYIGPLKALINDQFYRLEGLLENSGIPIQSWHGDISQSKKQRFLRHGQGILQITPESLEAMLINRQIELSRLFGDLRYVVLDEVHAFISSDRGRQVLCQLQRLARYQTQPARRIGLSATVGEPALAMAWLAGGTDFHVTHISDKRQGREVLLGLEHFIVPDAKDRDADEPELKGTEAIDEDIDEPINETDDMFRHMSKVVNTSRKTLIFANSRNDTEEVIHNLRRVTGVEGEDEDGYYVHHGSISVALRERAEQDMRDPDKSACVAATVTLELGIDIGNLDQVLQVNAPYTVSSFVQRLGRSGRREGQPAKMFFYSRETRILSNASLGERIPWGLLQTIATTQLYLEERWIEPPYIPALPVSLLYHQTMSVIVSHTEMTPPEIAERVLTLTPFSQVSFDQYRELLRYLLEIGHLERIDGGGLIIGPAAERLVNSYRFYATFETEISFIVREGTHEIGNIQSLPVEGDRFRLAGRAWKVIDVDEAKRIVQVERVKGKAQAIWTGGGGDIHTHIPERILRVLQDQVDYGYLQPRAVERLNSARQLAAVSHLTTRNVIDLGGNRFMLLPWQGSKIVRTMGLLLAHQGINVLQVVEPYYLVVSVASEEDLREQVQLMNDSPPPAEQLIEKQRRQMLQVNKYDRFVPESLLRTAYCRDYLDINGATTHLNRITNPHTL